jgi:ubiquinone/menaquinone biosynthesis C-methylase UbiE
MTYQYFAYLYDELMKDVPYQAWMDYITSRIQQKNQHVLDLACGTGSLSIPLSKMGFHVTGADLSAEMLAVADEKARAEQAVITLLQQDMTDLSELGSESFDTIICFCDSLNYLPDEQAVSQTFKGVYELLKPNGAFMFDVHSIEKIENVFINQTFVSTDELVSFIWNCFEGDDPHSVEHELTFFVKNEEQSLYDRYDELHIQRTYPINFYEALLKEIGFSNIEITSDFENSLSSGSKERIFFCCKKSAGAL